MRRTACVAALLLGFIACAAARNALPEFTPGGAVELRQVIGGDTLSLADGRELKLVGIEAPAAASRGAAAIAARAKDALARLVTGHALELRYAGNATDRNGRVLAELFADGKWVQRELVRRGLARVRGAADNRLGIDELLAAEAGARKARRGIWRVAQFAVRDAADAGHDGGTWQIVEGKIANVSAFDGEAHLDFTEDWRTGFGVHIGRDAMKLCRAAGLDPMSLKGARLRVRGFIDGTRRPVIELSFPEQIEHL